MVFTNLIATAALLAGLAFQSVNAVDTISVVGSKFYTSSGSQFYVKGALHRFIEI